MMKKVMWLLLLLLLLLSTLILVEADAEPLQVNISLNKNTVDISRGESITAAWSVTGGTEPYSIYYIWHVIEDGKDHFLQQAISVIPYSTNTFKPLFGDSGYFDVSVWDEAGQKASAEATFTLAGAVSADSLTATVYLNKVAVVAGAPITLYWTIKGGLPPYKVDVGWYLMEADGNLIDYGGIESSSSCTFYPKIGESGYAGVTVTDADGRHFSCDSNRFSISGAKLLSDLVSEIAAECTSATSGSVTRTRWLHDYIIRKANYDYTFTHWTAAGILIDGKGICIGFARAYKMLLDKVGIGNILLDGVGHAWNLVKIDGYYYHVDTTWDDVNGYKYFLKSDAFMRETDHQWDASKYPACPYSYGEAPAQISDLLPTEITCNADVIYAGDSVVLDSGIMNTGSTPTEVFNLKWFINDIESEYISHTDIPANTTVMDGNSQFDWKPTKAGEYTVRFFVDCDNHITEENEDNNWAFRTFTVLNPILIASPAINSLSTNGTTTTLKWGAVTGAQSYYVYRLVNGGAFAFLKGTTGTTISDSGLVVGNSYTYRVQANGPGGSKSEMSAVRSVTLKLAAPVISSLSASGTTTTLRWSAVTGAESYYVYRSVNGGAFAFLKGTTGTQVNDNSISGGSWVSYCVRANANSGAVSAISSAKGITVLAAPVISSLGANGTTATLKWKAVSGAASYYVYRSVNGGAYAFLKGTTGSTVNDPGLTVGSSYYYKVRANGSGGNESALSALKGIKISINLAAPVISSLNVSGTTATLVWSKVTYAESYYVYRSVNGGAFAFLKGTTGTTVNDSGLAAENSFAYRVQANGPGGIKSEMSAVRSFTLKLATPVISSLNTNGTTTATLVWGAVPNAVSYYIYRAVNGAGFTFLKGTTATSIKDGGLVAGNSYAYRVQANGLGSTKSDMSAVKSFTFK